MRKALLLTTFLILGCGSPSDSQTKDLSKAYEMLSPFFNGTQLNSEEFIAARNSIVIPADYFLSEMRWQLIDLDYDGVPELIAWKHKNMGMAGGSYLILKQEANEFRCLGFLGLGLYKPLARQGEELMRIASYWRSSSHEGSIEIYTYDGQRFSQESIETVEVGDGEKEKPGNIRLRNVFGRWAYREGHTVSLSD